MIQNDHWTSDERLSKIPQMKLDILKQLAQTLSSANNKQSIASILPILKTAKQNQLEFTKEELALAIQVLKEHSTEDENQKITTILNKYENLKSKK